MPPRKSSSVAVKAASSTLVIDNGAYKIKAGLVATGDEPSADACIEVPNCIARDRTRKVWIADALEKCNDFGEMAFRRPVEKGFITSWEAQRAIWYAGVFGKGAKLECDPRETNLILSEAPNCPQVLQIACDEVIFEEFEFTAYSRFTAPALTARSDIATAGMTDSSGEPAEYCLVVDAGYSHTIVTPLIKGRPVQSAIRRLTIGGKFLTNYLREMISLRQFNVLDEPWLVNEIKESTCYVSQSFKSDLEKTWKGGRNDRRAVDDSLLVEYVLPDFQTRSRGIVREYDPIAARRKSSLAGGKGEVREPTVLLGNERFSVPELLFSPQDVGMKEAGLPGVILQSLDALPDTLRGEMLANVVVVGGTTKIPGFVERLTSELRPLISTEFDLNIKKAEDPTKATYLGGAMLASSQDLLRQQLVTRAEYQEHGAQWLLRKFASGPQG